MLAGVHAPVVTVGCFHHVAVIKEPFRLELGDVVGQGRDALPGDAGHVGALTVGVASASDFHQQGGRVVQSALALVVVLVEAMVRLV
ncbi:hypothetical protein D9M71_794300 [compost metagenome]